MDGIIVVNKPQNFTSFDVVAVMRRLCGQRKIGHTGTLDPMATGVLPLLLGSATRAQDILPDSDKEYVAQFRLGIRTDTLDIWGEVIEEKSVSVKLEDIMSLIPKYSGEIIQIPPMYSAVKKDGVRLYDLARRGIEVEREARKVTISQLKLLSYDDETFSGQLKIACSKGTYIRTLIDDIGRDLGCGAVMTSLVRTKACGFTLEDSATLDEIKELSKEGECAENTKELLRSCESLFTVYRKISVSEKQAQRFSNGNPLDIERTAVRKSTLDGEI
ncbi:MAG: tRNA pseudouridine(55) synthase TruB, partial [Clostridia bacterium]|nr:tRNA pseudouridine(55) synthase TruB [Clostridia bacterium]